MMLNFSISWLPASLYRAGHCGQVFIRILVLSEQFAVETKQFHFRELVLVLAVTGKTILFCLTEELQV